MLGTLSIRCRWIFGVVVVVISVEKMRLAPTMLVHPGKWELFQICRCSRLRMPHRCCIWICIPCVQSVAAQLSFHHSCNRKVPKNCLYIPGNYFFSVKTFIMLINLNNFRLYFLLPTLRFNFDSIERQFPLCVLLECHQCSLLVPSIHFSSMIFLVSLYKYSLLLNV